MRYAHWRQTGLKSGGAEWEFETYLVKIRDLFSNTRLRDQKKQQVQLNPLNPLVWRLCLLVLPNVDDFQVQQI